MSWPGPKPDGRCRLPMLPPMALAQPPPLRPVVNHGSHTLTDTVAANSATNQPGRGRNILTTCPQAGANTVTNLFSDSRMSLRNAPATIMPMGPNSAGPPRCTSRLTTDSGPFGFTLAVNLTLTPPTPTPSSVIDSGGL